jgi:hypothetical protein
VYIKTHFVSIEKAHIKQESKLFDFHAWLCIWQALQVNTEVFRLVAQFIFMVSKIIDLA